MSKNAIERNGSDYKYVEIIIITQLFIYLRAELNSQWPITESA
jgi:hypothetical protein